jgi:anthranilate phosphoribosyltransferase
MNASAMPYCEALGVSILLPCNIFVAAFGFFFQFQRKPSVSMLRAVQTLGMQKALVVHSMGLDELTPMGPADVVEVTPLGISEYSLDPLDVGIPRCKVEDLAGGDASLNAKILMDVFEGKPGPVADALILNAGYALAACEVASGPVEGIAMARKAQQSGSAAETLQKWVEASQAAYSKEAARSAAAAA